MASLTGDSWLDVLVKARKKDKNYRPKITVVAMMNPQDAMDYGRFMPTGSGANGIVEPSKPAAMFNGTNPPSVLHEGEMFNPASGRVVSNAEMRQSAPMLSMARTEADQQMLQRSQQASGLPGFATGGNVYNYGNTNSEDNPYGTNYGTDINWRVDAGMNPLTGNPYSPGDNPPAGATTGLGGYDPGFNYNTGNPNQPNDWYRTTAQTTQNVGTINTNAAPFIATDNLPQIRQAAPTVTVPTTTAGTTTAGTTTGTGASKLEIQAAQPVTTTPAAPTLTNAISSENLVNQGISALQAQARGESEAQRLGQETAASQFNAAASAERSRFLQELKNQGLQPDQIDAQMARYDRQAGVSRAEMVGKMQQEAINKQEKAQTDLFDIGIKKDAYDRSKVETEQLLRSESGTHVAAVIAKNKRGYDWINDPETTDALQRYWSSLGFAGTYNQDWATRQIENVQTTAVEREIENTRNSPWYQALDPEKRKTLDQWLEVVPYMGAAGGYQLITDENGNLTGIRGADGKTITVWPTTKAAANLAAGIVPVPEGVNPNQMFISNGTVYINKNGTSEEITFDPSTLTPSNAFGTDATKILALGRGTTENPNPYYNQILEKQAEYFVNPPVNQKPDYTKLTPELKTTLINTGRLPTGAGTASTAKGEGKRWLFTNYETSLEKGTPINIDGKLYRAMGSDVTDKKLHDWTRYKLVSLEPNPDGTYPVIYETAPSNTRSSMRTTEKIEDAAAIAALFGGGFPVLTGTMRG